MNRVLDRLMTADGRTILSNSSYFIATTSVTAGLGFAYWWIAAQTSSPAQVGLAATAVSLMALLGNIAMLGFGTFLIAELHRRADRAPAYIATALLISCVVGVALGIGAILLLPLAPAALADLARYTVGVLLFPLGVALTAASLVADEALVGLLRGGTRFVRNCVFAAGKLVLLVAAAVIMGGVSGETIFAAWIAGLLVSMFIVVAIGLRYERRGKRYMPNLEIFRHLGRAGPLHHALNMAILAPPLALPLVVAAALSATSAGYFYVALTIAGIVSIAAPALGITLYAVASRSPSGLPRAMRLTLVLSFLITGIGCAVVVVAGRSLLATFGASYAAAGTEPLIVLSLATLPGIIKVHFIQVHRIRGRIGMAAAVTGLGAVLELTAAGVGAQQGGLVGSSAGFAVAVLVEAAAMSPSVLGAAELWGMRTRQTPSASLSRPGKAPRADD